MRGSANPDASCAGLTRASIFFVRESYEDGWIAGASPAMMALSWCIRVQQAGITEESDEQRAQ
jgi:hypothetical protein